MNDLNVEVISTRHRASRISKRTMSANSRLLKAKMAQIEEQQRAKRSRRTSR